MAQILLNFDQNHLKLFETGEKLPENAGKILLLNICKTSQELRMLSRSLSDCKSLLLNVMIQVSQFIRNGQLCH